MYPNFRLDRNNTEKDYSSEENPHPENPKVRHPPRFSGAVARRRPRHPHPASGKVQVRQVQIAVSRYWKNIADKQAVQ
ncbi:MAG: hypothetical protein ACRD4K_03460, partial [Candidatus Acidiferrales bacterium]